MHFQQSIQSICLEYTQAMFAAQRLESDMVLILTFHHESCPDTPEATLRLIETTKAESEKLPLGQLIKAFKKRILITLQQESILTDALKIRNDLAHNFLGSNYKKIISPDFRASLISEIQATTATLNLARNELKPHCTAIFTALSTALADQPQTAEKTNLQSHLDYLLAPAEPFPVMGQ